MKAKRKICFITGTRSDYGLMRNVLKKIDKEFDLSLIVVGMHLSEEFGETVKEIKKDGFKITKEIHTLSTEDTGAAMARAIGIGLIETTKVLEKLKPDLFLILGDRDEAMVGALASAHLNIPIVHIHGGDQGDNSGHVDDSTRHAVTKFAHLHLAATKLSAERIKKLGEEGWRVKVTGSPALDEILSEKLYAKKYLEKKYGIDFKKILILALQHASPNQIAAAEKQMKETMEALKEINQQTILIYPNSDAGSRQMIKVINEYKRQPFLKIYKNLPRKDYLSLMKYAKVLVGNSSSGTIDTPSFKLPVVNIGTRESVREHAGNKIFVGHNRKEIVKAIKKSLFDKKFIDKVRRCRSPYGNGRAGERIVAILKNIKINKRLLTKKLTY
jgi:UDP-N-acetylglucosamine 2-epimerase (non-hydrolysing)/GDP/UDP-N,N'-diacetylbacillosamine 2-epimerase (hydrolysing)